MSLFPDVPDVLGVPPLLRNPLAAIGNVTLLTRDALTNVLNPNATRWGIFDSTGAAVIEADSVLTMEYRQDWRVANYPIEPDGNANTSASFASYNKVAEPYDAKLRFARGGSVADRDDFLSSVAAIAGDTNLYSVAMPEFVYLNANIVHYGFSRTNERGVGLLQIDIYLQQVRVSQTASPFSTAKSPGAANPVNAGTTQAAPSAYTDGILAGVF